VHSPLSPAWANFTLMMECTPESRRYFSVYSVTCTKNPSPDRNWRSWQRQVFRELTQIAIFLVLCVSDLVYIKGVGGNGRDVVEVFM
jgi:hypothetical protein